MFVDVHVVAFVLMQIRIHHADEEDVDWHHNHEGALEDNEVLPFLVPADRFASFFEHVVQCKESQSSLEELESLGEELVEWQVILFIVLKIIGNQQ